MAIGQQRNVNDLTSYGVNDEDSILETAHERSGKKTGKVPGSMSKPKYGSDEGEDNMRYSNRSVEATPDQRKLERQAKPDDRKYAYIQ